MKDATTLWVGISNQIPQFKTSSRSNTWLVNTREKDSKVRADHKLNMSQQFDCAAKKTNIILCCINQSIVKVPLYSVLVGLPGGMVLTGSS